MTFHQFIPFVSGGHVRQGIGIADGKFPEDRTLLKCCWYFDWGATNTASLSIPGYVPMSFNGNDPGLPMDYSGYLLVFNEPEVHGQADMDPITAASRYGALVARYPHAKMIVGGCGLFGREWLKEFRGELDKQGLPEPCGWHVHGYIERFGDSMYHSLRDVQLFITWVRDEIAHNRGEFWVTEWNDTTGVDQDFRDLYFWIVNMEWINRYAVFTNRATGTEWWWPSHWAEPSRITMLTWGGMLTARGQVFMDYGLDLLRFPR